MVSCWQTRNPEVAAVFVGNQEVAVISLFASDEGSGLIFNCCVAAHKTIIHVKSAAGKGGAERVGGMSFQLGGHFSGGTILAREQWITLSETRNA